MNSYMYLLTNNNNNNNNNINNNNNSNNNNNNNDDDDDDDDEYFKFTSLKIALKQIFTEGKVNTGEYSPSHLVLQMNGEYSRSHLVLQVNAAISGRNTWNVIPFWQFNFNISGLTPQVTIYKLTCFKHYDSFWKKSCTTLKTLK